jgi:CHAT domain-containing protein
MPPAAGPFKMLVAIQPATPGYKKLPFTIDELRNIEKHVSSECLIRLGIPGKTAGASVKQVYSNLPAASIVHLACHGEQKFLNPLESALCLQDGRLEISRIMEQSMPNASLVYLSACETAMGDNNLPDEAFHLAAALLFAGFRGAVATMW